MSFVRTPVGLILHAENHRALVELAEESGFRGALKLLTPAEPVDPASMFESRSRDTTRKEET